MEVIRNVRIATTLLGAGGVRLTGTRQVDILLDATVALVDRPKISETLRMESCSALVQDEHNGYGLFLMGFNDNVQEIATLKLGQKVSYIGKSGTFRGREKFTAFEKLPMHLTVVNDVLVVVPEETPASTESDDARMTDPVAAAFGGFGDDDNVPM